MYTCDLVRRVTIRLDVRLAEMITSGAEKLGISPSDFVRRVLWASLVSTEKAANCEDEKTNRNNNL